MTAGTLEHYIASFRDIEETRNGGSDPAQRAARREAMDRAAALGFPTQRHEEWRYTNLSAVLDTAFAPAAARETPDLEARAAAALATFTFIGESDPLLVFIDGRHAPALSRAVRAESARAESAAGIPARSGGAGARGVFAELNEAFVCDAAVLRARAGAAFETPVTTVFFSSADDTPRMSAPRVSIIAERGSAIDVIEVYASLGDGPAFTNAVTDIEAAEDASVRHTRLQIENSAARHIGGTFVVQRNGSSVATRVVTLGGALTRNDVSTVLDGEHCEAVLEGLTVARGTMHVDNHTRLDHARPSSHSLERYKHVLDDTARAVFSGRILVREHAQKTDAKQSNNTLLLSPGAVVDAKPQLEIFADDVKCTHGATVGRLDGDALFYLRSRGIGEEHARAILTLAFADELLAGIPGEPLRGWLHEAIHERLRPQA
ncbi:MAG: Fe-S cluster assembly protein SufD [Ignavibacteriae bacterium]|nr:Fe-S cluster assembly protein SufD [Ignavibacteriota bacterium]